ncbi:MAG: hypothetical protein M1832_004877 [Thelocarpon impressellum]|nr:MAG: hypothetical protein M1832_004877 [Thelocarpon impressellum]
MASEAPSSPPRTAPHEPLASLPPPAYTPSPPTLPYSLLVSAPSNTPPPAVQITISAPLKIVGVNNAVAPAALSRSILASLLPALQAHARQGKAAGGAGVRVHVQAGVTVVGRGNVVGGTPPPEEGVRGRKRRAESEPRGFGRELKRAC